MHLNAMTARGFRALKRILASTMTVLLTVSVTPGQAADADLTSKTRDNVATQGGTIKVGSTIRTINPGDMLTDAEHVALQQMLDGGKQTILLNALGIASGGSFQMSHIGSELNSLVIPKGVTALQDISSLGNLNITGNLTNSGKIYLYATDPSTIAANIAAQNIYNNAGGLLSSIVPTNLLGGLNINQSLNLNLSALQDIINAGIIRSSGALSLTAGNSIVNTGLVEATNNLNLITNNITNSNLMSSIAGNINISALNAGNINVNNINGTLQALLGSINVRDSLFNAKANFNLTGGDVLSNVLNIYSGTGIARVNVNALTGLVNINAGEAHVAAKTSLNLGDLNIVGDPTFYSFWDINFNNSFVFDGESLAIVAGRNIIANGNNLEINTGSATGNGGDITLVAGAKFTLTDNNPLGEYPAPTSPTNELKITGGSTTGGRINLNVSATQDVTTFSSASTFATGDGGDIKLIAFKGSDAASGTISVSNSAFQNDPAMDLVINSSGGAGGDNGDILVIAGGTLANGNPAIALGGLNANGTGSTANTGRIDIYTATPSVGTGVTIVDGKITAGSFAPGTLTKGGISVRGESNTNSSFNAQTGGNAVFSNITAAKNVFLAAGSPIISGGQVLAGLVVNDITSGGNIVLTTTANNTGIGLNGNINAQGDVTITAHGTGGILGLNRVIKTYSGDATFGNTPNQPLFLLGATLNADGTKLFQPNYGSGTDPGNKLYVIDPKTGNLLHTITANLDQPQGTALSPDGSKLYVANWGNATVTVYDADTYALIETIEVGVDGVDHAESLAVSPDGNFVYVLTDQSPSITTGGAAKVVVIDASNNTTTGATIAVGQGLKQAGGIVINSTGSLAYVSSVSDKKVYAIDLLTNTTVGTIDLSNYLTNQDPLLKPYALAIDPNGSRVYVGMAGSIPVTGPIAHGQIAVIDSSKFSSTFNTVIGNASLPVGGPTVGTFPQGISLNPTGTQLMIQGTYLPIVASLYTTPNQVLEFANVSPNTGPDGYGSTSFTGLIHLGEVPVIQTFASNTQNLTGVNNISVVQQGTIMGDNVTLQSGGGYIVANYAVRDGGTLKANTGGNGAIFLNNLSQGHSFIGASSAPKNYFEVGSLNSVTVSGPIVSPHVTLRTVGSGNLTIGANVGTTTGVVNLSTVNGDITQTAGLISAKTLNLTTATGDIGTSLASLQTKAANITALAGGNVFLNNTGAVVLGSSAAVGMFQLTNSGNITLRNINADALPTGGNGGIINVSGGNITLTGNTTLSANAAVNGDGGEITLNGQTLGGTGNLSLSANGANTGNGGTISVTLTGANTIGTGSKQVQISAISGANGGDAGDLIFRSGGNLTVNTANMNIAAQHGGNYNGSFIELNAGYTTAGNLFVTGNLDASGQGNGNGGVINLMSRSATAFNLRDGALVNGITGDLKAEAGTSGNGGLILIQNRGTGGLQIDADKMTVAAHGEGNGGGIFLFGALNAPGAITPSSIAVDLDQSIAATFGPGFVSSNLTATGGVNFITKGTPLTLEANGSGLAGNGGAIAIVGTKITSGDPLVLQADGSGTGNGGTIAIGTTGSNSNITVGNQNGQFDLSAQSGNAGGNGGAVSLKANMGNITVDPAFLKVGPRGTDGNGGSIQLAAGISTSPNRNVFVNGNLDISGTGVGNGGSVFIITNSLTALQVGAGTTVNGVNGSITANGGATSGAGGTVVLSNYHNNAKGVGVSIPDYSNIHIEASAGGGNGGSLMIADLAANNVSPTGDVSIEIPGTPVNVNGSGPGNHNGGTIVLQAGFINGYSGGNLALSANGSGEGNGGTIVLRTHATTSSLTLGAGAGEISASATGGSTGSNAGDGGTISVTSPNLVVNAGSFDISIVGDNGNGGSLAFNTTKNFTIEGNLDASGKGTGNGGEILITTTGSTIFTGPTILSAAAGLTGTTGGRISLQNAKMEGLTMGNDLKVIAEDISLNTKSGAITAKYDALGGVIRANASGDITLTNEGTVDSKLGASKSGGMLTVNSDKGLIIDELVTATKVISLTSATGSITQGGANGLLSAPNVQLTTSPLGGDIGTGTALLTKTPQLTVSSGNDVNIKNTGNVNINNSSADGLFALENAGSITVAKNGGINAPQISLRVGNFIDRNNGSIFLNAGIGSSRTDGNNILLETNGTGSIIQAAGNFNITGGIVTAVAGGGGTIGSVGTPIRTDSNGLKLVAIKSAYASHTGNVDIYDSVSFDGTVKIVAQGDIDVKTNLQGSPVIYLESLTGDIKISSRVGSAAFGTVTLVTDTGDIYTSDPTINPTTFKGLEGLNVTIKSNSGNIGDIANSRPLATTAVNLSINTTGDADIFWSPNVSQPDTLFGYALNLTASNLNELTITANGPVIVTGPLKANNVSISTTNVTSASTPFPALFQTLPDLTRDIYIRGNIGTSGTGTTTLNASNSGNGTPFSTANIVRLAGTIFSQTVNLSSEAQDIGTTTAPILTTASTISATTGGTGSVFISNAGSVALSQAAAPGGTFSLVTTGTAANPGMITNMAPINQVKDLVLQTKSSNASIDLNGQAIDATNSISLTAIGSGSITDLSQTAILKAPTVNLVSGTGNIGADGSRLQIDGGTVTTKTAGAGGAFIHFLNNGAIGTSTAGSAFAANSENGANISIEGPITSKSVKIEAAGAIDGPTDTKHAITGTTEVVLSAANGDIGSLVNPVQTKAKTLTVTAQDGSAFIKNTGTLTINTSSTDNAANNSVLNIQNTGTTKINGNLTSDSAVVLGTTGALTQAPGGFVITAPTSVTLTSQVAPAAAPNTASFGTATARIQVETADLTTNTKGMVYVNSLSSVNINAYEGSRFDLTATEPASNVTVSGALNSANVSIVASGDITLGANVGKIGGTTVLTGENLLRQNAVNAKAIGTTVKLTATDGTGDDNIGTLTDIFLINATNLTVNQTGNAWLQDEDAGNMNVLAGTGTHNQFMLINEGNIAVSAALNATTSVTLNSRDGNIATSGAGILRAPSIFLGGALQNGNIGTFGAPVKTDTGAGGTIQAQTSQGVVGLLTAGTGPVNIGSSFSGQGFQVTDNSGSLIVGGDIQAGQAGPPTKTTNHLNLIENAAGGTINVNADLSTIGGNILVNAKSTTGTITFGDGADVTTNVEGTSLTNGVIKVAVGVPPATGKNVMTSSPSFTVTNTPPGAAYAGVNPAALNPTGNAVELNALGRNIIFNSATNNSINFNNNVTMTAQVASNTGDKTWPETLINDESFTTVAEGDRINLFIGEALVEQAPQTARKNGIRPVAYHPGAAATSRTPALGIHNGAVLFAPSKDMTVTTQIGDLHIKRGAAILAVMQNSGVLSVYNLHDDGREDVSIDFGTQTIYVEPGKHTTVAIGEHTDFADVNAVDCIGHRNVHSAASGEYTVFTSEFSITSALKGLRTLAQLSTSSDTAQKRLAEDILKNAAIMLQLNGKSGAYQRVGTRHSKLTAMN